MAVDVAVVVVVDVAAVVDAVAGAAVDVVVRTDLYTVSLCAFRITECHDDWN
jgi:bacteriorhodopsin